MRNSMSQSSCRLDQIASQFCETRPATMASSSKAVSDSANLIEKNEDRAPNESSESEDDTKYVYDYIHVPVRSSLATLVLPPLGSPRWKRLGAT